MTFVPLETLIEKTIEGFDYERVIKTMKYLKWGWGTDQKVPTVDEMKNTCRDLFKDAIYCAYMNHSEEGTAGTGGFEVHIGSYINENNGEKEFYATIKFVVTDYDMDTEEINECK